MNETRKKFLIATGIYPPEIGGPAEYTKNLRDTWVKQGYGVEVKIFSKFKKYPWGLRHMIFFFYIIPSVSRSDYIVALDAFSAGVVTVASKLFRKTIVFRTGGDMLWEQYTERTGEKVLLRDFYLTKLKKLSVKEKIIFRLMRWTLRNLSAIVWSTEWQKNIFMKPYDLENQKHFIIENYYGPKESDDSALTKTFVASTRDLKLKNLELLERVFKRIKSKNADIELFKEPLKFSDFMYKIKTCYAVIQVSLGDISPNMILDAIRHNKPFICTKEVGIFPRIKEIGIFIDPLNEQEIEHAVLGLLDEEEYRKACDKVRQFSFVHTWEDIAKEFLEIVESRKL
ncbi:MAG: hypothetical protein WCW47_02135 [Candidatus Paceibacterota bacterium]|jgi:glycosyltransferase involved in cell wall biosynthesis